MQEVGLLKVELLSDSGFLWSVLCEEGVRVVNCYNRIDCEAMCGLMDRFCRVVI